MSQKVNKWRSEHDDWKALAAFIKSKNTGRRFKKLSAGKIDLDSVNRMPVNVDKQLQRKQESTSGEVKSLLGDRLLQIANDESAESESPRRDTCDADIASVHSDNEDSVEVSDTCANLNISEALNVTNVDPHEEACSEETLDNKLTVITAEDDLSSSSDVSDEDNLVASNSSDFSDDSDEDTGEPGQSCTSMPSIVKKSHAGPIVRANRETVVKQLNLNDWDADAELDVAVGPSDGAAENVSFLFERDDCEEVNTKKKDNFFVMDDSDGSESDVDSGISQTNKPPRLVCILL